MEQDWRVQYAESLVIGGLFTRCIDPDRSSASIRGPWRRCPPHATMGTGRPGAATEPHRPRAADGSPTMDAEILRVRERDGVTLAAFAETDLDTEAKIHAAADRIDALLDGGHTRILLDFDGVRFLGS